MEQVDILAIAAHRDDVEQTCGGALLRAAQAGQRTAILDLTQGESGTRGDAATRASEAAEAGRVLRVSWREALDLPDGALENTPEARLKVVRVIRQLRPRVVILPIDRGRHPDHYKAGRLGYEACFQSGLKNLTALDMADMGEGLAPWRPFKIVYASLYSDERPTFIVDITDHIEERYRALMCYRSQYAQQERGAGLFVPQAQIQERVFAMASHYGAMVGVRYGEPYVQREPFLVDDLLTIPVQSV